MSFHFVFGLQKWWTTKENVKHIGSGNCWFCSREFDHSCGQGEIIEIVIPVYGVFCIGIVFAASFYSIFRRNIKDQMKHSRNVGWFAFQIEDGKRWQMGWLKINLISVTWKKSLCCYFIPIPSSFSRYRTFHSHFHRKNSQDAKVLHLKDLHV